MNLPIIQVKRSDMFKFYSECFYDIYIIDHEDDASTEHGALLFKQFATEEGICKMFKEGHTPCLLCCEDMQRVEQLHKDELPFIIVVVEHNKVIATVHHNNVNY